MKPIAIFAAALCAVSAAAQINNPAAPGDLLRAEAFYASGDADAA